MGAKILSLIEPFEVPSEVITGRTQAMREELSDQTGEGHLHPGVPRQRS